MPRLPASALRPRTAIAAASTAAVLVGGAFGITTAATAQDGQFAVRAIGSTVLDSGSSRLNRLVVSCVTPGTNTFVDCVPAGAAVVTVDAATKGKLKLTSAVIARGNVVARPASGETEAGGVVDVKAVSTAVRKKLAKVSSVKLTYRLTLTGPVKAVLKTPLSTWKVDTFVGAKRLLLRSPGDDFVISGSRG